MRSVFADGFAYIFNAWPADGTRHRSNLEATSTWRVMERAAKDDPRIANACGNCAHACLR